MTRNETTTCVIAGGGPAGVVLGLLLTRAGVNVTVMEKHADFLRDFRGDTVHPSTLQILDELDLIEEFGRLPQRKITEVGLQTPNGDTFAVSTSAIPGRYKYVALVPQWDFLNLLTDDAIRYPNFRLLMSTEATGLIREGGTVRGVRYRDAEGEHELRATLTVAADGRHSTLREAAGMRPISLGAPMDVLWLRLPRHPGDPSNLNGRLGRGVMMVAIDRGDYWQIAYLIPKGGYARVRETGLGEVRDNIARYLPFLADRVDQLTNWQQIAMLSVGVDRLPRWYRPGFVCIGDAAHTMSPIGGVGINLAVQDAVAAANLLAEPLLANADMTEELLARLQRRRWIPTVGTQAIQQVVQKRLISQVLSGRPDFQLPLPARSATFRNLMARTLLLGILPEHVRTPQRTPA